MLNSQLPSIMLSKYGYFSHYDNGAGDVDRDFDALGLGLVPATSSSLPKKVVTEPRANNNVLNIKLNLKYNNSNKFSGPVWSREFGQFMEDSGKKVVEDESEKVSKEWVVFRWRANGMKSKKKEAPDRHMEIGTVLYDFNLNKEALMSFKTALELQPTVNYVRVRSHFYAGNCLYELGRYREAKEEFFGALKDAEKGGNDWNYLVPQIHLKLGIVLESEGMVFNACEHYRKAVILCPTHFRALKRLGSALVLVGEYCAGVKALEEAIFMTRDYMDAYYDLGLALIALGDVEKAILEFQKVLDLKPGDVDAFNNLGGIFLDMGRYRMAYEMYSKALVVWPNHWKAQLGKVVLLFGTGRIQEATKVLKEALKTANRVELSDRIAHLKQLKKRMVQGKDNGNGVGAYVIVEPSKFKTAEETTTLRRDLASALDIRAFQKITKLHQCDVELVKKQMDVTANVVDSVSSSAKRSIRKASVEGSLRELLGLLKPETFVAAVKAINQKILSVLDEPKSGKVNLCLFFAVIAPLCRGPLDKRKRVAYHALLLLPGNEGSSKIRKTDAQRYIKLLRAIYVPSLGATEMLEVPEETDTSMVSLTEFLAMFDNQDSGFGIMSTLLKLETGERNGSYVCASCRYPIIGSRFKEIKSHFSLCSHCYSEGKVPPTINQEEFIFKEYAYC